MNANLLEKLKSKIENAQAIVIGAGAGLSTSAGYVYSGKRFHENFGDFEAKYNFHDMYSGGFYPYETLEENWAYWSRYVYLNRFCPPPILVYENLLGLVRGKNYFVITTNVDHCFQRAGFDKKRMFYTQGDFGLFQCSVPCHKKTYDNEKIIRRMFAEQKEMKVPSELVPKCPKCGKPMAMNLRADETFVEDEGWQKACERYKTFLAQNKEKKILFLELGVGSNTPGIIKYPFWQMTQNFKDAFYVCINKGEVYIPAEIKEKSLGIDSDIGEILKQLQ
ncbi:MAG: Sir2 silent information regulator family NAD-dependent deacetylase [Treponemataceae bacterium]|nr:Sir2 silent information regulator family NAD-dependent deacetylase [Treponemataceae bacterium]